ncbi:Vacuolar protein sorting-associated protein [Gracilaria domingensis]|nr:Vacuolar protein sorting-associated protein [Gracilaria domingensis]
MGIFQNLVVDALARHFPRLRESLRVNLLRGKLHLQDVDVAPSFLILNNLPLQINHGKIGNLSVQVPWTKLYSSPIRAQAEEFRLSLSEVPFPSSQREVFDAFTSESENEKKRQLAEGERGKSPLSRVLTRILPMLLDRFELNIKNVTIELNFASGQLGIIHLDEMSTKPTPHAANRGDLDKLIVASGVSFTVTSETSHPVLCLSETSICLSATHRGGAWHIDLDVPSFKLEVNRSFPSFLKALSGRSTLWRTTYLHQRPNQAVEDDPRAWLQYAVRRVTSAFCKRRIYFSEAEARRKAKSFVKYKELHVKRLRRIADANEALQILELERSLGADAILILRDQARKHALANEVSSFATRDWLGWALLGTEVSQEQEQAAEELKHSLTIAKYGQASSASQEVSDLSTTWSKIRFGINLSFFHIIVEDEHSSLSFSVNAISMQAELDSSLESYNGSLFIESAKLLYGDEVIWVGAPCDDTNRLGMKEARKPKFLELKLYKLWYEETVTRSIIIQSCRVELDFMTEDGFERLRRIAAFAGSMQFMSPNPVDESRKVMKPGDMKIVGVDNVTQAKTYITVSRFTLLVRGAVQHPRRSSLNICCSLSDVYAEIESGEMEKSFHRGTLDISAHQLLPSTLSSRETEIATSSEGSETSKFFQVTASLRTETVENRVELDIADVTGFLELSGTAPFINSMFDIHDQFLATRVHRFGNGSRDSTDTGRNPSNQNTTYMLKAPSIDFRFRDSDGEGKTTDAVRLKLGGVIYEAGGCPYHTIRAQHIEIYESLYHDSILLAGSEFAIDFDKRGGFGSFPQRVESNVENLSVSVSLKGLSKISSIVDCALEGLRRPPGNQVALQGQEVPVQTSFEDSLQANLSFSLRLRRTKLTCAAYDICIQTALEEFLLVRQDNILTGFLDNLEVKDISQLSSKYKTLLRCVMREGDRSPRRKAISFETSKSTNNIQISALQVVWLKSVISNISQMHQSFRSTVNDICTTISGTSPEPGSKELISKLPEAPESGPLTVQGWDLTLIFPLSPTSSEAVCIISSHITATVSPKGQVISLRGGQILTRTDSSQGQTLARRSREARVDQWVVLVREIDTDFSHHSDLETMPSEHKRRIRDKWSIEILRRISLLIAPNQILVLKRFVSNTFSSKKTPISSDGHEQNESSSLEKMIEAECRDSSQKETPAPQLVSVEVCSLECETHHISIELLVEAATSTASTTSIANINMDPTKLSWKRSSKYSGTYCDTDVISWSLRSTSVSLEDRTNKDPGTRRMILHTRQDTNGSRSFHELGTEVKAPRTALYVEYIERTDLETKTTSSCDISLRQAQVVACPALFLALQNFGDQCSWDAPQEVHRSEEVYQIRGEGTIARIHSAGEEEPVSTSSEVDPDARLLENKFLKVPASKVTLSLRDVSFLLLSSVEGGRKPFVNIPMESVTVVLLRNNYGLLLEGSRLKIKRASVTMLRYSKRPQGTDSHRRTSFTWNIPEHAYGLDYKDYGSPETDDNSSARHRISPSRSSLPHRWRADQAPNRSGSNSLESTETILHLQSISIKLPSVEQNRIGITIPDVAIDCPLESLTYFTLLCADLELAPPPKSPLEAFEENEVFLYPDIQAIIGSVSLRTRIETTAALLSEHESVRNHAKLRLTGHGKFLITEEFQRMGYHYKGRWRCCG